MLRLLPFGETARLDHLTFLSLTTKMSPFIKMWDSHLKMCHRPFANFPLRHRRTFSPNMPVQPAYDLHTHPYSIINCSSILSPISAGFQSVYASLASAPWMQYTHRARVRERERAFHTYLRRCGRRGKGNARHSQYRRRSRRTRARTPRGWPSLAARPATRRGLRRPPATAFWPATQIDIYIHSYLAIRYLHWVCRWRSWDWEMGEILMCISRNIRKFLCPKCIYSGTLVWHSLARLAII